MFKVGDEVTDLYNVVVFRALAYPADVFTLTDVYPSGLGVWVYGRSYDARLDETDVISGWGDELVSIDTARTIIADDTVWLSYAQPIATWSVVVADLISSYYASK